jgi:phenylacetic acid degradation operon negative regulatory protein
VSTGDDIYRRLGVRRLTARSVIASTLLGVRPPELPTRSLVATAELLGIAPGTARVAMSRMVAAGELKATASGYRLIGPALLSRQERQTRSRSGTTEPWNGDWWMFVVTGDARSPAERVELRAAMTALRYGEVREGVWTRPDNLSDPSAPHLATPVRAFCVRPEDPPGLARSLWDLNSWASRADMLLAEVEWLLPALESGDATALAVGYVVSAAVLRHFQADPLLPDQLLPDDWPGPLLRDRYEAYDSVFRTTLDGWQRAHR